VFLDLPKLYKPLQGIPWNKVMLGLIVLLTIGVSLQQYLKPLKSFGNHSQAYTHYNNYIIFKQSSVHLAQHIDLYKPYPAEHWDLYKYSPAFALGFAGFAWLPNWMGLILWNLLNAMVLVWALQKLPYIAAKQKPLLLLLLLPELITSLQNSQSNALMAGLLILAFVSLERGKFAWATLWVVISIYIKLFGVVGFALFLFYPSKWKSALWALVWVMLFWVAPAALVGIDQLLYLYKSWLALLQMDEAASYGLSVAGMLHAFTAYPINKSLLTVLGILLFCLPLLHFQRYKWPLFRMLMLAQVLLWIVIFNHKAESPTFIIAMAGVAIWYFAQPQSASTKLLGIFALVFTSLGSTDLFPAFVRNHFLIPYALKALPCVVIWLYVIYQLTFTNRLHHLPDKAEPI
jgi:hypothetical protein